MNTDYGGVAPSNLFGGALRGKTCVSCEFISFICFTKTNKMQ